jgi:hypothetical protein
MKLTLRATRRILGGTALLCAAALLPGTAMAASAPSTHHTTAHHASAAWGLPRCRESQTTIWIGIGNGGGAAGTIFRPVEFTNTSRHACKLWGFPRIWGLGASGHQVGKAARHLGHKFSIIELWPNQTAHATVGFIQAGNVCSHPVDTGLVVRAPHQGSSTQLPFFFKSCPHRRVLVTGPVMAGVGIP